MNAGRDTHKGRKKAWGYYRCSTLEKPGRRCPKAKKMSANVLESAVLASTKDFLTGDSISEMLEEVNRQLRERQKGTDPQEIQGTLIKLDRSISNLLSALEEGTLTEQIRARLKKRQDERLALLQQLHQAQSQLRCVSIEDIRPYIENLEKQLARGPVELKRDLLRWLIHRIEIYREYGIIQYTLPTETGGTHDTPPGVLAIPPVFIEAKFSLVAHR